VRKKDRIISAVDVGTTKICALIARAHAEGRIEIISTGYAHSAGLKKGIVVDIEEAAASIRKAREEAEMRSGVSMDCVNVGISGDHIEGFNCHGAIPIEGKNHEVSAEDVEQVITAAQSIPTRPEREVIHVLTQEFLLDNRGDIQNPVGLTGSRLDVNIHVVTCDGALLQNVVNAVNRADMRVSKVILQHLASAESVLTADEMDLGVAVVDIGGGTTDIAFFGRDAIRFTSFLPIGGSHFTRDLAIGLRIPIEEAERVKKECGSVLVNDIGSDEVVDAQCVGAAELRSYTRLSVCRFLRERAIELMELVKDKLTTEGDRDQLITGVVLTGGGSALDGMVEVAEEVLEVPVRQGLPYGIEGLNEELSHPVYATSIGLAKLGANQAFDRKIYPGKASSPSWLVNRFLSWVGN
jgi:cell division protein FtsA